MEEIRSKVDEIFKNCNDINKPGFAVSVINGEEENLIRCYGGALLSHRIPVSEETAFYLCSLSKQFTAFCVCFLIHEDLVSLEDKLIMHIPELPEEVYGKITVSHLLHMCSGIHEWYDILEYSGSRYDRYLWRDSLISVLCMQKNLSFEPGERYSYCNYNYALLVFIIEKVSGISLLEFAKENIFKPLGMNSTFFCEDNNQVIANEANGYIKADEQYTRADKFPPFPGAGGVYSNILDMTVWLNVLINGSWQPDIFQTILTPSCFNNGKTNPYLMGLELMNYKNMKIIHHGGSVPGFNLHIAFIPNQKSGVIWMANHGDCNQFEITNSLIDIVCDPQANSDDSGILESLNYHDMASYDGVYRNVLDDKPLVIEKSDDSFCIEGYSGNYEFITDNLFIDLKDYSRILTVQDYYNVQIIMAADEADAGFYVKPPGTSEKNDPELYCGKYYSEELDVRWTLFMKNDLLSIKQVNNLTETDLRQIAYDIFMSPAKGFKVRFQRDESKMIKSFYLDSFRSQKFLFLKC